MKTQSKFTWKKVIILGTIIGILLGTIAYIYLLYVGHDLEKEMTKKGVEIIRPLE